MNEGIFRNSVVLSEVLVRPIQPHGRALRQVAEHRGRWMALLLWQASAPTEEPLAVEPGSNEIPVLRTLLEPLAIQERVITADVLHTQRETARFLVEEKGAQYLFTLFTIKRQVTWLKTGQVRTEQVFCLTGLTPEQAGADRLPALNRDHWRIENGLHWVRDVTFDEDRCQVHKGSRSGHQTVTSPCLRHSGNRPADGAGLRGRVR